MQPYHPTLHHNTTAIIACVQTNGGWWMGILTGMTKALVDRTASFVDRYFILSLLAFGRHNVHTSLHVFCLSNIFSFAFFNV